MRSCGPTWSRYAASTVVVSSERMPSAPSGRFVRAKVSASAACTRSGTCPVTWTTARLDGGSGLAGRLSYRIERLALFTLVRGRHGLGRGVIFGLADVQEPEDAAPPHLHGDGQRGDSAEDHLEEHAAAGRIDVVEIHRGGLLWAPGLAG